MSGTNRIGLDTFTARASQLGGADAALRISKNTGDVTTAEHGFLSKAVRFFFGPTKQDIADNTRLFRDFHADLSAKFGPDIADSAILRVRQDAKMDGNALLVRVGKPLTAFQVRSAVAFAQRQDNIDRNEARDQAIDAMVLRFAPGGPGFARVAARLQLDPADLSDEQTEYVAQRLREEVTSRTAPDGTLPDAAEIQSIARKLARRADGMDPVTMGKFHAGVATIQQSATDLVGALSGTNGRDPMQVLGDIMREGDDLVLPYVMDAGDVGTDDRAKPFQSAIRSAVAQLTPDEAGRMLRDMRRPDSTGFKAMFALMAADTRQDPYRTSAIGQASTVLDTLLGHLAERAGTPGVDVALQKQVDRALGDDAMRADAGVRELLDTANDLIAERAEIITQQAEAAQAEDALLANSQN